MGLHWLVLREGDAVSSYTALGGSRYARSISINRLMERAVTKTLEIRTTVFLDKTDCSGHDASAVRGVRSFKATAYRH